jgi:hypothetical protein
MGSAGGSPTTHDVIAAPDGLEIGRESNNDFAFP